MEKRKIRISCGCIFYIIVLAVIIGCIAGIIKQVHALNFFDTYGRELIEESISPDGSYVVRAYLSSGGATTDYAVLGTVEEKGRDEEKDIYLQYHCDSAEIEWIDSTTVMINGVTLDVRKDTYDYRKEQDRIEDE